MNDSPQQSPESSSPRSRGKTEPTADLKHHQLRCSICRSESQGQIEEAFISWESVDVIAGTYAIPRCSVYRHAHATGLFARRDRNIRRALGLLIHRADKVRDVSADAIIRAAQTLARINERGEWTTPPTRVIVTREASRPADEAPASQSRQGAGSTTA